MTLSDAIVFVVDDDPSVRKGLSRLIKSLGFDVKAFASAQEFLDNLPYEGCGCLVLDVRMPGISGLDLQNKIAAEGIDMPIIFITGHGDIPMSVRAIKAGAVDFLEKPLEEQTILDAINEALQKAKKSKLEDTELRDIQQRVESLTKREYEVFLRVVSGRLNKQIAYELGISEKTIKVHRARAMKKMRAESLVDLVRLAQKADLYTTKV